MSQEIKKYEVTPELLIDIYRNIPRQFVEAVVNYANMWQIDPHLKIYHIVEFKGKSSSTYSIMPSITLFRIQASRSGTYVGKSVPIYGPTQKIGDTEYPEYCQMTVSKLVGGQIREFSHETRWLGCYSKKGAGSLMPNDRWAQDPYGMIAKTTESQLLRMVWPEMTGSQPAYEEMEGKEDYIDAEVVEQVDKETGEIKSNVLPLNIEPDYEYAELVSLGTQLPEKDFNDIMTYYVKHGSTKEVALELIKDIKFKMLLSKKELSEAHNKFVSLLWNLSEEDGAKFMQYYAKHDCTDEVALQLIERIEAKLKEKKDGEV